MSKGKDLWFQILMDDGRYEAASEMKNLDLTKKVPFYLLQPGDVWECPTTHERFIKTELTAGFNCVRLSDGKLMNRVLEWKVLRGVGRGGRS